MRFLLVFLFFTANLKAQYYYPPVSGSQWDTVSPASLGWCISELDTLSDFLEATNGKGFIILHKGKIAYEEYFGTFQQDSVWYWASAGKALTAFLVGMAQEQGLLNIDDKTSDYLGTGWTSAPTAKENLITIRQQLQMTTGLDYTVPDLDCVADTCLLYRNDAGTHWYYHNAPYRLLQDVVVSTTNLTYNQFTAQQLGTSTGITGFWFNYLFLSKARSMARFGLLALSEGRWNGTPILADTAYFNDMVTPSQNLNEAYGYLWWLNGQPTFKQPGTDIVFNGPIIPSAPADLYMAAGKNDQRIYVVPSEDLVVVRIGNAADQSLLALSGFDDELWRLLGSLICHNTSQVNYKPGELKVLPNPATDHFYIEPWVAGMEVEIYNLHGQRIKVAKPENGRVDISHLRRGAYLIMWQNRGEKAVSRLLVP